MILERRPPPRLLSLVLPCFNEEEMLPHLREQLTAFINASAVPVEVILVDDGSRDRTLPMLIEWSSQNPTIKIIALARNFGHQNAATAGLEAAQGEAVVLMDADLQDPLELIAQMIEKYAEGYDVAYGQRLSREGESPFKRLTAWLFYRLMKSFVHPELPPDAGDFRLISRPCLDALRSMHETHRFLRGMVAWVGFAQTPVPYHRKARVAGSTKYPVWKMMRFAWNAIVSFSPLPLRVSFFFGIVVAVAGALYGIYAVVRSLTLHDTVPGWTTQIILTSLLGGAILVSNGILGEYIGRIFEEMKGRPLYVVARRINF